MGDSLVKITLFDREAKTAEDLKEIVKRLEELQRIAEIWDDHSAISPKEMETHFLLSEVVDDQEKRKFLLTHGPDSYAEKYNLDREGLKKNGRIFLGEAAKFLEQLKRIRGLVSQFHPQKDPVLLEDAEEFGKCINDIQNKPALRVDIGFLNFERGAHYLLQEFADKKWILTDKKTKPKKGAGEYDCGVLTYNMLTTFEEMGVKFRYSVDHNFFKELEKSEERETANRIKKYGESDLRK